MPKIILMNQPTPPGDTGVIQTLFSAAADLLFQHSPSHPCQNSDIRVTYGVKGPHTRWNGDCLKGYDVDLVAGNDYWCQHLYQFSHEIRHVFAQHQQSQHPNQWFEESACETSSLYCMKKIAAIWAAASNPYHQHFDSYAENLIKSPDRAYNGSQLQPWLQKFGIDLRRNPEIRCLNGVVANKLLDMYMAAPSKWGAVEFLNAKPCSSGNDSFPEYLDNWQSATPSHLHTVIQQVRAMFV